MADHNPDVSNLSSEMESALAALDAALALAGRSVAVIRSNLSQISALAQAVREMEAAITTARENLSLPLATMRQGTASPQLRPVPLQDAPPEVSEPDQPVVEAAPSPEPPTARWQVPASTASEPQPPLQAGEPETTAEPEQLTAAPMVAAAETELPPQTEPEQPTAAPTFAAALTELPPQAEPEQLTAAPMVAAAETELPPQAEPEQPTAAPMVAAAETELPPQAEPEQLTAAPMVAAAETELPPQTEREQPASHCLRLAVSRRAGSLDLKVVDGSVNENPAVVDVALLDYDGRQATLKLWINQSADPVGVRDALLRSLRRRLGDERDAEVDIDFEQESAA